MHDWLRLLLLTCLMMGILPAWGAPTTIFSDELDTPMFDCTVTVLAQAGIHADSAIHVDLNYGEDAEATRVSITTRGATIASISNEGSTPRGKAAWTITPGTPCRLTLMRRGTTLAIAMGETLCYRGEVARSTGTQAGITAGPGWTVQESSVQRIEPVSFADSFMRSPGEAGPWQSVSGDWRLQSAWDSDPHGSERKFLSARYAQNPFAWVGRSATGPALCVAGYPTWEDYSLAAAVCPAFDGAVGLLVNMPDRRNGLLVRWSPANDRGAEGNRLALYRLKDGQRTLLQASPGGYVPGQWYRLTVACSAHGVRVSVDGDERLSLDGVTPWRGAIGLYAEGNTPSIFDDVTAYGRLLNTDLMRESEQGRVNQRFLDDAKMGEWIAPRDWTDFGGQPGHYLYRFDAYGDQWLRLQVRPTPTPRTGELWLTLQSDGVTTTSGYRAVAAQDAGKITYAIYRGTVPLARGTGEPLAAGDDHVLRFWHIGTRLWLEVDGATVVETTETPKADQAPLGLRPAYRASGCFLMAREASVLSRQALDYIFAEAPVDWIADGTWQPTVRWACSPEWSFLGGWSRGDAVLWHKQRFTGDQYLETFAGLKMEYPREREVYDRRNRDIAVTICGDGRNPRSGYTGIYGAPGADGTPNQRTVLMRNGVIVGARPMAIPTREATHQDWFHVGLRKRGATVELFVENTLVLSYTDPEPIDGGAPAIWTTDNGICLARARLFFANPSQPRTDPRVIIDQPWYPEWGELGQPTRFAFPESWSTTGQPVRLQVTARKVPGEDAAAARVGGTTVTLSPKELGEHWYQVTATDGANTSAAFDISLPFFNPALGRDDSRAQVLYRFNEGSGTVVHDRSPLGQPADLAIPDGAPIHWWPGQGLHLTAPTALTTTRAGAKLKEIQRTKACTLEFWVSPDTKYPEPVKTWMGTLLEWGSPEMGYNLTVGHQRSGLIVSPLGTPPSHQAGNACTPDLGYLTSLHHYVVTWDGTVTSFYRDGELQQQWQIGWDPTRWGANAPLVLGAYAAPGQFPYLGTYYLVAIHDKALPAATVQRHYQAGPSAK